MLNYIWAGLIALSLLFALVTDFGDMARNTYRNGASQQVRVRLERPFTPATRQVAVTILPDSNSYRRFYGVADEKPDSAYSGSLVRTGSGVQLRFSEGASLPPLWANTRKFSASRDDELQANVSHLSYLPGSLMAVATFRFEPVRFVKLRDMSQAALDMAETAAGIALGLIGILALFLGLLKIAEKAGLVHALVRVTQPIIRPLFPEIPKDHPALGMIVLNLTANVLGLGNAATPLGLKAMEELQRLNPKKDTATNAMVMLLALNTASVQIVPPVLLVAVMGLEINALIGPILIVTFLGSVVAVISARLLGKLPRFRKSDPALYQGPESIENTEAP